MQRGNKDGKTVGKGADKSGKGSKPIKPNNRPRNNKGHSTIEVDDSKYSRDNDPEWYNLDQSLTRDAASITYSHPVGTPLVTSNNWATGAVKCYTVPGVCAIEVASTLGTTRDISSPANLAAQQMYSFITHANSRNTSYDAADVMQYFLAVSEAYSYVEFLKRVYGCARLWHYNNKYFPDVLLKAMWVDPDDVRYKMADFRLGINMMINKLATFAVPNTMSLYKRKQFMYSGLYTEGETEKDPIYMFVPANFFYWEWKKNKLTSMPWHTMLNEFSALGELPADITTGDTSEPYSVKELLWIGNHMIDAIMGNADMGLMNGDVLKAYGSNILTVSQISEDYTVVPSVSIGVLEQIQNSTIVPLSIPSLSILSEYVTEGTQEGASIITSYPGIRNSYDHDQSVSEDVNRYLQVAQHAVLINKHVLQTRIPNPEPKYNLEITRLTAGINLGDTFNLEDGEYVGIICGTEVVTAINIYADPSSGLPVEFRQALPRFSGYSPDSVFEERVCGARWGIDEFISQGLFAKTFAFLPTMYTYDMSHLWNNVGAVAYKVSGLTILPSARTVSVSTPIFTTLGNEDLENMHKVAVLSEFYVPKVAKATK